MSVDFSQTIWPDNPVDVYNAEEFVENELTFQRRHVPPKGRLTFTWLHGVISQKIEVSILSHLVDVKKAAIRTSRRQARRTLQMEPVT
jgi:hypothetical protein